MMDIYKSGDVAIVQIGSALFERIGDVAFGECDGMRYEQVGDIRKFSQFFASKSRRLARVNLKKMRQEAFA